MASKKKVGLIKKDPMKSAPSVALKFALRGGSAIAAGAASNMASGIIPKFHGPIASAIGLAGEIFLEDENARAIAQGVGTWGAIETAKEFVPESVKPKLGLGSTDSNDTIEINSTPDWDALAEEMGFEEVEEESIEGVHENISDEEYETLFNQADEAQEELELLSENLI